MTNAPDILQTMALADIMKERLAQVSSHGFTPEMDALRPVAHFLTMSADYAHIAEQRTQPGSRQDLLKARIKAVQAAALAIVAVERLDLEIRRQSESELASGETLFNLNPQEKLL